jgi:hypothetical protein
MKTLTSCSKPIEAQLLVARLAGSGIGASLRDELTINNDWLYSNALGGVRVEVEDEDYEKAVEVMRLQPEVEAASDESGLSTKREES